jgi:hypothetical protein
MDGFEKIRSFESSESRHDRETFKKASELAAALGDVLNSGSSEAAVAGFLDGVLRTHRYLSNSAVIVLLTALGDFGALPEPAVSDARNAFAYKLCRKLRESFKDDLFWRDK